MSTTLLLEKDEMARVLERLASQILERHAACQEVMLVGIERRGADLARRLAALLQNRLGHAVPLGTLDINLYRDDWTSLVGKPSIGQSKVLTKRSSFWLTMCSTRAVPFAQRSKPCSTMAAPVAWSC